MTTFQGELYIFKTLWLFNIKKEVNQVTSSDVIENRRIKFRISANYLGIKGMLKSTGTVLNLVLIQWYLLDN